MKRKSLVKIIAENAIKKNVDSACVIWCHQPKLPKGIEKFKKKI